MEKPCWKRSLNSVYSGQRWKGPLSDRSQSSWPLLRPDIEENGEVFWSRRSARARNQLSGPRGAQCHRSIKRNHLTTVALCQHNAILPLGTWRQHSSANPFDLNTQEEKMNSKALMINTYITIYRFVCVQFRILKQKFSLLKEITVIANTTGCIIHTWYNWQKKKTVLTACNICHISFSFLLLSRWAFGLWVINNYFLQHLGKNTTLKIMLDMHVKNKSRVKKDACINEFTLIMLSAGRHWLWGTDAYSIKSLVPFPDSPL